MINLITDLISFTQPTNLDRESLSVIESIAKLKNKVNECINEFNSLNNKNIEDYKRLEKIVISYKEEIIKLMNKLKLEQSKFEVQIRDILTSLNTLDKTLSYIKTQYTEMEKIAKENTELIESMSIVSKEELNSTNYMAMKFKPDIGVFMDLNPGGSSFISSETIDKNLNLMLSNNINHLVVQPWITWDSKTNTCSLMCEISELKNLINKAIEKNIIIECFKVHTLNVNFKTLETNNQLQTFFNQYKTILSTLLNSLIEYRSYIKNVVVLNECNIFYKKDSQYKNFALECITLSKDLLYKTGISTMGCKESVDMDKEIQNKVDKFFFNCYPKISYKGNKTTLEDAIYSWDNSYELKCCEELHRLFPEKDIIMSETGCNDNWMSICNPGDWTLTTDVKTNGKAPSLMLEGLMNSKFNNLVDSVWWCYWQTILNDKCKNVIKRYKGVI